MPPRYQHHFYRVAFLLFCVAPTVYTLGWIVERQISTASAAAEAASLVPAAEGELSRILGATVTLGKMEYLPGHITLLTDVQLHDPETGALLATATTVEMYYAEQGTLAIEPVGLVVEANQLSRLAEMLHARVLRELPTGVKVDAQCARLQLVGGPREETLADVHVTIGHSAEQRQAIATFRPAWNEDSEPLRLEIIRRPDTPRPATSIAFHTGHEALPATWFEFVLPSLAELGDACSVQGSFLAREETDGWESTFSGVLRQVELDRVVARRLRPYPLGTAQLQVDQARWRGGRLVDAEGLVQADALHLSWRVLAESFNALGLAQQPVLSQQSLHSGAATTRGLLRCLFTLDANGLVLMGEQGIVLRDGQTPLLGQPAQKLAWTPSLVTLCTELGLPPLESVPVEFQQGSGNVRLRD